jgi:hypothetical protein
MFGATILLVFSFATFLREIAILRARVAPQGTPEQFPSQRPSPPSPAPSEVTKATGRFNLSAVASVTALPPLSDSERALVPVVQDYVRSKVPDARNWEFTNVSSNKESVEFVGSVYDSILLPYKFKITTTTKGEVLTNQSSVR